MNSTIFKNLKSIFNCFNFSP